MSVAAVVVRTTSLVTARQSERDNLMFKLYMTDEFANGDRAHDASECHAMIDTLALRKLLLQLAIRLDRLRTGLADFDESLTLLIWSNWNWCKIVCSGDTNKYDFLSRYLPRG